MPSPHLSAAHALLFFLSHRSIGYAHRKPRRGPPACDRGRPGRGRGQALRLRCRATSRRVATHRRVALLGRRRAASRRAVSHLQSKAFRRRLVLLLDAPPPHVPRFWFNRGDLLCARHVSRQIASVCIRRLSSMLAIVLFRSLCVGSWKNGFGPGGAPPDGIPLKRRPQAGCQSGGQAL